MTFSSILVRASKNHFWPLESGSLMSKSENQGTNFLRPKWRIFKFIYIQNSHIKSANLAKTKFLLFLFRKNWLQASCDLLILCPKLSPYKNIGIKTLFRDNGKGALKQEYRKLWGDNEKGALKQEYRNIENYKEIMEKGRWNRNIEI